MKDKTLIVKVDDQFIEKVDYLKRINDFKNRSDTVRKVVEKEYRKEQLSVDDLKLPTWDAEWSRTYPPLTKECPTCEYLHTDKCKIVSNEEGVWVCGKEKNNG